jgi:hypothetical protein
MKQTTNLVLIIFAGAIMVAHGLRMMTQGLFYPQSYYPAPVPSSIDFWFDWFSLAALGLALFVMGVRSYYQVKKDREKEPSDVSFQPT